LKGILAKIRPEPVRKPLPPPNVMRRHRKADTGDAVRQTDRRTDAEPCWADWRDVERDLIHTRTVEGRSRAQKRGQHMDRPPKLTAAQQAEARRRRAQGAILANWRPATAWERALLHG
jgi:hypothetical protein